MTAAGRAHSAARETAARETDDGGQEPGAEEWGTNMLSVRYGAVLALDRVTLRAVPGEITAVVGGDGAGRTTLLRCVSGLVGASEGEIRTPGLRQIGYLQADTGMYPDLSVEENLAFRATAFGVEPAAAGQRVNDLLERTGLAAWRQRLVRQLSGGMRKKLGVIAVLLHHPKLLLFDEPTTGVDPVSRADLWWLIAHAAAEGAAIVMSTSYLDEAERATSVLVLDAGREVAAGTPDEIVAAVPGAICVLNARPRQDQQKMAWRRGRQWRLWCPDGNCPAADADTPAERGQAQARIQPDLQDAVTVAVLARELDTARDGQLSNATAKGGVR